MIDWAYKTVAKIWQNADEEVTISKVAQALRDERDRCAKIAEEYQANVVLENQRRQRMLRMTDEAYEIIEAAKDLVALWKAQKIPGATRAERNSAIEATRQRLVEAVDAVA